jgi:hypothetical protein
MIRPMASGVSTLSGGVANGHQIMHFVSFALSKIPYGGFSPVRLQTSLTPQPPSQALAHPLIGCHRSCLQPQRLTRRRTFVQAALRSSTQATGPVALGSPTGCIVRPAHRLLWPHLRLWNHRAVYELCRSAQPYGCQLQRVPNLLCQSLRACRRPYSSDFGACLQRCLRHQCCLRHLLRGSAITFAVGTEMSTVRLMKLQRSHNATARRAGLPCFGQDVYYRACLGRVTPTPKSVMTRWVHRQFPIAGLSPAALTALWAAAKGNEGEHSSTH